MLCSFKHWQLSSYINTNYSISYQHMLDIINFLITKSMLRWNKVQQQSKTNSTTTTTTTQSLKVSTTKATSHQPLLLNKPHVVVLSQQTHGPQVAGSGEQHELLYTSHSWPPHPFPYHHNISTQAPSPAAEHILHPPAVLIPNGLANPGPSRPWVCQSFN